MEVMSIYTIDSAICYKWRFAEYHVYLSLFVNHSAGNIRNDLNRCFEAQSEEDL